MESPSPMFFVSPRQDEDIRSTNGLRLYIIGEVDVNRCDFSNTNRIPVAQILTCATEHGLLWDSVAVSLLIYSMFRYLVPLCVHKCCKVCYSQGTHVTSYIPLSVT